MSMRESGASLKLNQKTRDVTIKIYEKTEGRIKVFPYIFFQWLCPLISGYSLIRSGSTSSERGKISCQPTNQSAL